VKNGSLKLRCPWLNGITSSNPLQVEHSSPKHTSCRWPGIAHRLARVLYWLFPPLSPSTLPLSVTKKSFIRNITSPGRDQDSKLEVQFVPNVYSFCTILQLKNCTLDPQGLGRSRIFVTLCKEMRCGHGNPLNHSEVYWLPHAKCSWLADLFHSSRATCYSYTECRGNNKWKPAQRGFKYPFFFLTGGVAQVV
jgi:hypothetical protein